MDFHLERGLRLHTKPEHKNLYQWAINEIDAQGRIAGDDQIPWPWTLRFTATSCALGDGLEIKTKYKEDGTPALRESEKRQVIRVPLRPGSAQDDEDVFRRTSFSMFGTDRTIKSFQLDIYPIADSAEQESCSAWGCVSYTSEIDFKNETTEDCIIFSMFVTPETFARYAAKIIHGAVNEMVLSVGSVAGFYSEWSPSISTGRVKVLTKGSEQNVSLPAGVKFEPPRLGEIGTAQLYMNRRIEFAQPKSRSEDIADAKDDHAPAQMAQDVQAQPQSTDPRVLQTLASLRRAAWFVVCLVALIFVASLLRQ